MFKFIINLDRAGEDHDDDGDLPNDHVVGHHGDRDNCDLPDESMLDHDDSHHSNIDDEDYLDLPEDLDDGRHGDDHDNDCDMPDELMLVHDGGHHGNSDAPADTVDRSIEQQGVLDDATSNADPNTVSTDGIELPVNDHDDQETPSLTESSNKFDNSNCDNTSKNHQDTPPKQGDTSIDQSQGIHVHEDDAPSYIIADEMLQNSIDQLFNDTSVDDLFNDNI